MKNKKQFSMSYVVLYMLGLSLSASVIAAPIVIEGVVPNQASKQVLLNKMREIYGQDQVVDKLQVAAVAAPNGWSDSVAALITPELKKVSKGQLVVQGTTVALRGLINNQNEVASMSTAFQALLPAPYQLSSQLSVNQAEQKVIDDALKNRIIEFESGSAILTPVGTQILDEMVVALNKVQEKNIKIIGHTDNLGDPKKNIQLSQARAEAVKQYLVSKNIASSRLSLAGLGANQPVADNGTADGRRKNRRIEFEVL
ncbi:OmpA family protein [Acinetobacter pullicarnis]|uniref:OmpA family protein n=1 Tax=Acinetobacter pullicarnis TaxID=2576829 RepID=UPI001122454B